MLKLLFVDLETTGTDPTKHGVVQIAGQIWIDGVEVERFEFKLKPLKGQLVAKEALEVTGLTLEMLKEYPEPQEVFQELRRILCRYVDRYNRTDKFFLYAYNAAFDYGFLRKFFENMGDKFFGSFIHFPYIDVMTLAAEFLKEGRPWMENFKLATVAREFDIPVDDSQCHGAQYDIDLCREIYGRVLDVMKKKYAVAA